MIKKTIAEINEIYDLEIPRIINTIKKENAKNVLLQFPDGLKHYSQTIADHIEDKTSCNCIIYLGTCFGACDLPINTDNLGIDLVIQFGHSNWSYSKNKKIKVI